MLKEKKVPKISEMLAEAKLVGNIRVIACSAGLEYMGVDGEAVSKQVDEVLGLPAIISLTAKAETTIRLILPLVRCIPAEHPPAPLHKGRVRHK